MSYLASVIFFGVFLSLARLRPAKIWVPVAVVALLAGSWALHTWATGITNSVGWGLGLVTSLLLIAAYDFRRRRAHDIPPKLRRVP